MTTKTSIANVSVKRSGTDYELLSLPKFLSIKAMERNELIMKGMVEFIDYDGEAISRLAALKEITNLFSELRAQGGLSTYLKQ